MNLTINEIIKRIINNKILFFVTFLIILITYNLIFNYLNSKKLNINFEINLDKIEKVDADESKIYISALGKLILHNITTLPYNTSCKEIAYLINTYSCESQISSKSIKKFSTDINEGINSAVKFNTLKLKNTVVMYKELIDTAKASHNKFKEENNNVKNDDLSNDILSQINRFNNKIYFLNMTLVMINNVLEINKFNIAKVKNNYISSIFFSLIASMLIVILSVKKKTK